MSGIFICSSEKRVEREGGREENTAGGGITRRNLNGLDICGAMSSSSSEWSHVNGDESTISIGLFWLREVNSVVGTGVYEG